MQVYGNNILIQLELLEEIHGIHLPIMMQKNASRSAIVRDKGKCEWLKNGDKIIINGYTAKEVKTDICEKSYIIKKEDVLCKFI